LRTNCLRSITASNSRDALLKVLFEGHGAMLLHYDIAITIDLSASSANVNTLPSNAAEFRRKSIEVNVDPCAYKNIMEHMGSKHVDLHTYWHSL